MDLENIQLRKDSLMAYFSRIIREFDEAGNCIVFNSGAMLSISKKCADKNYRIKPGQYIVSRQTGEMFLFLGVARLNTELPDLLPWVLREGKFKPTMIYDSYLTEQFDEKYSII